MVVNCSARGSSQGISAHELCRKKHRKAAILAVIAGATVLAEYSSHYLDKKPIHTSQLTGEGWLKELMKGGLLSAIDVTRYSESF